MLLLNLSMLKLKLLEEFSEGSSIKLSSFLDWLIYMLNFFPQLFPVIQNSNAFKTKTPNFTFLGVKLGVNPVIR
jgi:hypothetical protein